MCELNCYVCGGFGGRLKTAVDADEKPVSTSWEKCRLCRGRGSISADPTKCGPCAECDGSGYYLYGEWEGTAHPVPCTCTSSFFWAVESHCRMCGGSGATVADEHGKEIRHAVAVVCDYGGRGLTLIQNARQDRR
jgi:hypothetical protein